MIIKGTMGATRPSGVIIQYLKSLGIKIRPLKKAFSLDSQKKSGEGLFGVPLPSLPLCKKEGDIPQLLVDLCQFLCNHLCTEGLFRKSGSVVRIKALKAQLESGEASLLSAHPGDVACLLKQFFRELPHPLIPPELQDPLCQIQETLSEEHRGVAIILVTCLLPSIYQSTLRYFCSFLQSVASRSHENLMDSGNLAVVLAPNLFSNSGLGEKLTLGTERQLQIQACVMQTLIEQAETIGQPPMFVLEKMSLSPSVVEDEVVTPKEGVSRRRRRVGGLVNDALNKLKSGLGSSSVTPERAAAATDQPDPPPRGKTKRKASEDSGCADQCTAKKRKSLLGVADDLTSGLEPCDLVNPVSPLADRGRGAEVFLDVPPLSPGAVLELIALPLVIPPTSDPPSHVPRARGKKENKRAHRSGLVPPLERKDKVRNSMRLFNRSRPVKDPTADTRSGEESNWNLVKRLVSEALEGPIFNGRDFWLNSSSIKSANTGLDISSSRSSLHPPKMVASSGKKSRSLRRSLSMPESLVDCGKAEGDGHAVHQTEEPPPSPDIEEVMVQDGSDAWKLESIPQLDVTDPYAVASPGKAISHDHMTCHRGPLRGSRGSACASLLCVSRLPDNLQRDCEERPAHPIQRKGARRFGRSLSHESGIGLAEETGGGENPETGGAPLIYRNRQVFISRKNITLSSMGQRNWDIQNQGCLDEEPADTDDPPAGDIRLQENLELIPKMEENPVYVTELPSDTLDF
ncbi:uncharacterized protein RCH25_043049 [Pelodytes ibericus]